MQKVLDSILESGYLDVMSNSKSSTQWFILKLECGHLVGRYTRPLNEIAPKNIHCEYCSNNQDSIQKNYDYTSDTIGWKRNSDTGFSKQTVDVKSIEVLVDEVYIEYDNYDSDYISFSKAKKILKESPKKLIRYSVSDNKKAIDFINNVPKRTTIHENGNSYLKAREHEPKK